MRRMTWTAAVLLCITLLAAACGAMDAESVVKDLDKRLGSMESYQGSGTMKLNTGQQPLEYKVEVSYQKPSNYRIKLTNEEKDITQIVLRNDDGVFVLTPKLNKVFRFQSDWPQNQGQVYLYQTLVQSILIDESRLFTTEDESYVFDVMANYNNGSLARQKIWLDKTDYKPVQVQVSDTNAVVIVEVKFDSFDFGQKFDKSVFDTDANMKAEPSSKATEKPALAIPEIDENAAMELDEESSNSGGDDITSGDDTSANAEDPAGKPFIAMEPSYTPDGVIRLDITDIVYGGNPGLLSRYAGEYNYTLIQTEPEDMAASLTPGMWFDLGFTVGQLNIGEDQLTLTWIYEGQQFRLASDSLPEYEMIKIAQSVQGQIGK